jgi:hypothetical protein
VQSPPTRAQECEAHSEEQGGGGFGDQIDSRSTVVERGDVRRVQRPIPNGHFVDQAVELTGADPVRADVQATRRCERRNVARAASGTTYVACQGSVEMHRAGQE